MSQIFNKLDSFGYTDCFYKDGKLWGFHNRDVLPKPIPEEIINAAGNGSTRDRLAERLKSWCDGLRPAFGHRRGINLFSPND